MRASMVELLGFDWSVAQVVAAGAVAALVLCLLIHLCAAARVGRLFQVLRCLRKRADELLRLRTAKVAPTCGEARPRRPTRRGRRRRDDEGGEAGRPAVTVNTKNGPDEGPTRPAAVGSAPRRQRRRRSRPTHQPTTAPRTSSRPAKRRRFRSRSFGTPGCTDGVAVCVCVCVCECACERVGRRCRKLAV